jgi:hypothetical protein
MVNPVYDPRRRANSPFTIIDMSQAETKWLIWILLAIAALLIVWLDHTYPFPHVIRNGDKTFTTDNQTAPLPALLIRVHQR